jgi:hypothetical protein
MIAAIYILASITLLVVFTIFCKRLIKKLELPEIEWNDQKELPTEIREDRNISKDIIVYDLYSKKLYTAYYSFGNDIYVFIKLPSENWPTNFVWTYLN